MLQLTYLLKKVTSDSLVIDSLATMLIIACTINNISFKKVIFFNFFFVMFVEYYHEHIIKIFYHLEIKRETVELIIIKFDNIILVVVLTVNVDFITYL